MRLLKWLFSRILPSRVITIEALQNQNAIAADDTIDYIWTLVKEIPHHNWRTWHKAIEETHELQKITGTKHRCIAIDGGLRHIWCDGSNYCVAPYIPLK